MSRMIKKLSKDEIAAIRRAEIAAFSEASRKAAELMRVAGITPETLERVGRVLEHFPLADLELSPAQREAITACRRAACIIIAIGPDDMRTWQPALH